MSIVKKNKYLYFPLLLLLLFFGIDKLCLLEEYKRLTMEDAPYLIFEYKEKLLDQLEKTTSPATDNSASDDSDKQPAKLAFVLGTSRLLFFDYNFFAQNYPDWELYNFSGPVTFPAYYLYILESALAKGAQPDLLIIETAPFQYSDGTNIFERSNLAYSFSPGFIWRYFNHFTRDEVSGFVARYLFASYRYPPRINNIMRRIENRQTNKTYQVFLAMQEYQKKHRGSARNVIPKESWFQTDHASMQYQARHKTVPWLYTNYKLSERQFFFLEQLLSQASTHGTQVILVRPAVSQELLQVQSQDPRIQKNIRLYESRLEPLIKRYGARYIDFNQHPEYHCNTFVDDAHMAIQCYHAMMDQLMGVARKKAP